MIPLKKSIIMKVLGQLSECVVLPISRGDSFLLLVLCGEAPCFRSSLMFST